MPPFNLSSTCLLFVLALSAASLVSAYNSYVATTCSSFNVNPQGSEYIATCNGDLDCSKDCVSEIVGSDCQGPADSVTVTTSASQKCLTGFQVLNHSSKLAYLCKNESGSFTCQTRTGGDADRWTSQMHM
ncbi:putative signal peptide protein [Puccinia sorghi]|uniref:Putative signal peptide protein n=1 Tax=Puccinia sorghi TaxID=27349 RepID=A0A0L6VD49_9BASI|nr:putative signal peptide protein [Puccinia sorghi]